MTLNEAAPYLRFADLLTFREKRPLSKTYDSRLFYVFRGAARLEIDGREIPFCRGNLLLFHPGKPYFFEPKPEIELIAMDFDYTQRYADPAVILPPVPIPVFDDAKVHEAPSFSDAAPLSDIVFLENASFLEAKLEEILQEFRLRRLFFREKSGSMLKNILFEIVRHELAGGNGKSVIDQIQSFVDDHIGKAVTNREIGEALFYNPNYLNRLMIRQTGMSLHRYILQRRLAKATQLLLTTQEPVGEIASKLGFYSASHFSNFFKRETGISPVRYRKKGSI
ncbi:MAG: helix-turn-helix domain-containing protein [Clostridia bacterium]|nr:helix-turn-helix domain-containing protein [Clostridia bacterium]